MEKSRVRPPPLDAADLVNGRDHAARRLLPPADRSERDHEPDLRRLAVGDPTAFADLRERVCRAVGVKGRG
jgi:hypothetical protein